LKKNNFKLKVGCLVSRQLAFLFYKQTKMEKKQILKELIEVCKCGHNRSAHRLRASKHRKKGCGLCDCKNFIGDKLTGKEEK